MAIIIRKVNKKIIALCAAGTEPKEDDLFYLDDNIHHALYEKFEKDFKEEGLLKE